MGVRSVATLKARLNGPIDWNIDQGMHKRISVRLDTINEAAEIAEINVPGYNFHSLSGFNPARYSIHVNGPWCITFEFKGGDAFNVDFAQYH